MRTLSFLFLIHNIIFCVNFSFSFIYNNDIEWLNIINLKIFGSFCVKLLHFAQKISNFAIKIAIALHVTNN